MARAQRAQVSVSRREERERGTLAVRSNVGLLLGPAVKQRERA
jgi:hypothetical protein